MAKREVQDPYWVYPGERRACVVQAKNKRHAIHKVAESPEYDGFPIYIYTVEDYARRCASAQKVAEPAEKVDEEDIAVFIAVKSVDGVVNQVFVAPTGKMITEEVDKLGRQLSPKVDALVVYKIPLPEDLETAETPKEVMQASFFYKPPLGKKAEVVTEKVVVPPKVEVKGRQSLDGGITWVELGD